jgi:hypothetical protein
MKTKKILRIFGIAVIMSLVLSAVPALPALAANDITLSSNSGQIGDIINVYGEDFTAYYDDDGINEYWAQIYFSNESVSINTYVDDIDSYEMVATSEDPINEDREFEASFEVPDRLTHGDDIEDVTTGTYYVYVNILRIDNDSNETIYAIKSKESFTVTTVGTLDALSPASGPAGTDVTVSGSNFPVSTAITFRFDSTTLIPKSGDSATRSSGIFLSTVTIPATATAGSHNLSVTISGTTVTKTFTVTASATLDPLSPASGAGGTDVLISGANFPASTAITFKFDTTVLTPKSGDAVTRSSGVFISTITVPTGATAGAHTITVTVGTKAATAQFTISATAALNPLSPLSGEAGTDVTVSGTNFMASYPIIFKFDDTTLTPKSGAINTDTTGGFTSVLTVPASATAGAHNISVTVESIVLTASFTVTETTQPPPPPTSKANLSINVSGDTIGSQIGIGGAGFKTNAKVTVKYDDIEITTVESDAKGLVTVIFEAPPSKAGDHIITLSDGTNTGTETFTVESKAPDTPPPLLPEMGAKEKFPITFDWEDVTDVSFPVTYNLQIATDKSFAANSIILDEKDITISEYLLPELEELDLESQEGALYWRVRALDAASNASPWTGAGEFSLTGSSSFPGWALYTILAVAGVLLFLLGLWVGRRTAFYY